MKEQTTLPTFAWTKPYPIAAQFYREGFHAYQKKYVLKRNSILMVLFFVLLVSFVISAVQTPDNQVQYLLMMVCLAGIFVLWYNPRKQRRMVMDAVRELEAEQYTAMCDGNVFRIQTIVPEGTPPVAETRVLLANAFVKDMEEFYLICDGKRMFYILPKEALELQKNTLDLIEEAEEAEEAEETT